MVCLTGDGGLGMVLAELETVARLALPVTVVVFNDATLSLIAIKQGAGQGDATAVRYAPVDLAAAAAALGVPSAAVDTAADATRVLRAAWPRPLPARRPRRPGELPAPHGGVAGLARSV